MNFVHLASASSTSSGVSFPDFGVITDFVGEFFAVFGLLVGLGMLCPLVANALNEERWSRRGSVFGHQTPIAEPIEK